MSKSVTVALLVFVGGAIGTLLRSGLVDVAEEFEWSVWVPLIVANTLGAFLLGWFSVSDRSRHVRALAAVGALGSFTTFSGIMVAFVEDLRSGEATFAILALGGSLAAGVLAATVGRWCGT